MRLVTVHLEARETFRLLVVSRSLKGAAGIEDISLVFFTSKTYKNKFQPPSSRLSLSPHEPESIIVGWAR